MSDPSVPIGYSLRPRLEYAAKAFLVASFVGALAAGALRLSQRALVAREHRIDLSRWTILERPVWSTLDDVRVVRDGTGLSSYYSNFYDAPALATVDSYLARPPQVKRVAGVRRVYPNRLEAVLEMRRPVAAVLVPGKAEQFVETDDEGVALTRPMSTRPMREGRVLRVIVGATGATAPVPGSKFGPDVCAAAWLADSLDTCSDDKGREQLAWLDRIDVSNFGGRLRPGTSEVLLFASPPAPVPGVPPSKAARCIVEWGRAGDRDVDGDELPFGAKASRLLQALRLFPRLEGQKRVRVAFADLVVVPDGPNTPPQLTRALEIDGGVKPK